MYDFSRSFLTFRIDTLAKPPQTVSHKPPFSLNNARIQLDCVCEITERSTGIVHQFVLGVNCKTERVGVAGDIWTSPNADFVPIVSVDQFLNIKTYAWIGQEQGVLLHGAGTQQPDRQVGNSRDAFDRLTIHLQKADSRQLHSADEICSAAFSHTPIVARTAYSTERYQVALIYPVKTLNINERDGIYQTDTGPILWPNLNNNPSDLIQGFDLAFTAFNSPTWIEWIVRRPVEVPGGSTVYHYSQPIRQDGIENVLFAL